MKTKLFAATAAIAMGIALTAGAETRGPDSYGYVATDQVSYTFNDITATGAKVLGGFTIGEGATVGSNAVVVKPSELTPLTTIRQSVEAMGDAAVRALLDEIGGEGPPRAEYVFRPELVVRGSTGAVPHRA